MEEENILKKKELRNRLNSIRIDPEGFQQREYGISIKYFKNNEIKPYKRIDYDASVDLKITHTHGEIIIDKKNLFYNQYEPDLINEIISSAVFKATYPIKTHYNEKGYSSNEIINHQDVLSRWEDQKEKLLEKYDSETLNDVFSFIDHQLKNKEELEKSLHYDWFWNLFFHPKLINYGERRTLETDLYLAIIPYKKPIRFLGIQKIEKIPTDYHSFLVEFKSNERDAPSYFGSNEDEKLYMTLNVSFDSDLYNHFPMHIIANLEIYTKDFLGNKEKVIQRIEFSLFQQNTEIFKNMKLNIKSPFITGGLVKLPPNKWGFDNLESLENDW